MTEIIPAIMPESFGDLKDKMREVSSLVSFVQIDLMDGDFVPSISWPYNDEKDEGFESILKGDDDMPYLGELEFEVDLMVKDQEIEALKWMRAGARRIIGHFEAMDDPKGFIDNIRNESPSVDSFLSVELGIAIGIETSIEKIEPYISEIDFVQCMGIGKIGYQGESFDDRVVEKVKLLRKRYPKLIISVDGGVNQDTAPQLIESGVNRLAIGSAVFKSDNIEEAVEKFQSL